MKSLIPKCISEGGPSRRFIAHFVLPPGRIRSCTCIRPSRLIPRRRTRRNLACHLPLMLLHDSNR